MNSSTAITDEVLCEASRNGDRNAFGMIVERYQTLLCSLAFSRTGNLAASQDIAQEAFLTAWRGLNGLRDPGSLKPWLCGIVRNLAANANRKNERQAGILAEPIDNATPETEAVTREEESLLWSALDRMPPQYRDPLVLFYREDQSIARVAIQLDLTEDAVKQRLSRGRAMLRGRVAEVVESALTRSKPRSAFTGSVLGAIALSAPGSSSAAVIAGSGAAKMASGSLAMVFGPVAGLSTAWLASVGLRRNAKSEGEREVIRKGFVSALRFCIPMILLLLAIIALGLGPFRAQPGFLIAGTSLWTFGLLAKLISTGKRMQREIAELRPHAEPKQSRSSLDIFGLPLFAYGSSGLDPGAPPQRAVKAWIAIGDFAISPLLAIGGIAIAPVAIGGVTIGILSLSISGIAVGVFAVGAIAAGWCAFGMAAIGWKAAAGAAVIAGDYALGGMAQAAEANTADANAWFAAQWFTSPAQSFAALLPWIVGLCIVAPICLLFWRSKPSQVPAAIPKEARNHALDALRAVALLAGILLHSTLHFLLPPGMWAVGSREPQLFLGWLLYYLHSFRLELFFLLAGYFGCLAVERRGTAAYVRDRAGRIGFVFAVAFYPMKVALNSLWIIGGRVTGWLPPSAKSWYELAWNSLGEEHWPNIGLTHLWFLYALACITTVFLVLHAMASKITSARLPMPNRGLPLLLAAAATPLLAQMKGMDVDTPDQSFAWNLPVFALYGIFFATGWWMRGNPGALESFRESRRGYLILGLVASAAGSAIIGMRYMNGDSTAMRWASSFGTAVTMTASTFGWLGAAQHWFRQPSRVVRYLAEASYGMYVFHLPVVVALQIALAGSGLPWWVQIPLINSGTIAILVAGRWLLQKNR